jgi:hypothetical protein
MQATTIVTAAPLAPPTSNGRAGGYGLWHAEALLPNGQTAWGRGLSEATACANALKRAAAEWAEVEAHLTACEIEAAALEAGDIDPRD